MSETPRQWLCFGLAQLDYAIPLDSVSEVTAARVPNFVPFVPLEVGGILNVRGEPLPAVDGHALVGAPGGAGPRHALVLEEGAIRIGLLVDSVSRIERDLRDAGPDENLDGARPAEREGVEWVMHEGQRVGLVDANEWLGLAMALLTRHEGEERCLSAS